MKNVKKKLRFEIRFDGDQSAGLNSFSDTVEICSDGGFGEDAEGFFQECLKEYYDGCAVLTEKEWDEYCKQVEEDEKEMREIDDANL